MAVVSVIAVGSELHTDDGVGSCLLRELGKMEMPQGVRLLDAGLALSTVLISQGDADEILILDAAKVGGEVGEVRFMNFHSIARFGEPGSFYRSVHHLGVIDSIAMARLSWSENPGITIAGVEPDSIEMGIGLSHGVASRLPVITALVAEKITRLSEPWRQESKELRQAI